MPRLISHTFVLNVGCCDHMPPQFYGDTILCLISRGLSKYTLNEHKTMFQGRNKREKRDFRFNKKCFYQPNYTQMRVLDGLDGAAFQWLAAQASSRQKWEAESRKPSRPRMRAGLAGHGAPESWRQKMIPACSEVCHLTIWECRNSQEHRYT